MYTTSTSKVRKVLSRCSRDTKGSAEDYILANDEWKKDIIPEIMNGKNIADFIDPDIAEKLEALEREEEMLEAEGFYDSHGEMVSPVSQKFASRVTDFSSTRQMLWVGSWTRMMSVK